jgi:hypothetical protein
MASTSAGGFRPVLARVAVQLTTPFFYLMVLGGLQVVLLWEFRPIYGPWLAILAGALWLGLLIVIAARPGRWRLKLAGISVLAVLAAIVPTVLGMIARARVGISIEHDGLLQIESAVDRLLAGQPIYGVDWSGTPMARLTWNLVPGGNPALHHFAYYPLTVLVGVPFRLAAGALGLPWDYRVVLVAFAIVGLVALLALPITPERRVMLVCALYVNPLITLYLWPGRNDIEFLACVVLCLMLLARGHVTLAALALGIAVAFKPFAWPAVPFFLLVLYLRWRSAQSTRELATALAALAVVPVLTIAPFFLANPPAFWDDIVLYAAGGTAHAYPIAGYGFGELLYQTGIIARRTDVFPFALVQLAAMVPVLWFAGRAFLRRPTAGRWMAGYAALLLAFTFFARFFNDNYVGVVITLFLCARPLGDRILNDEPVRQGQRLAA